MSAMESFWHRAKPLPIVCVILASLLAAAGAGSGTAPDRGAVILKYHRFGESGHPSTNVRLDQFEAHLAELAGGGYAVLPLTDVVRALADGKPLPDRTVVLTIDDGWRSVYEQAWPRLRAAGLPFTVFVTTEALDGGFPAYLTWDQVRDMAAGGATIGTNTAGHRNLATLSDEDIRAELGRAQASFRAAMGRPAELLAYPYGVYSRRIQALAREAGFRAAVADHSGVAHAGSDPMALPRFAISESHGDLERLRLAASALALPVAGLVPEDVDLTGHPNPPTVRFDLAAGLEREGALACYTGAGARLQTRISATGQVTVALPGPLPQGRSRINCTMPGPDGRWRWLGWMFYVPGR
jgi:peptidoglycan/xylan/chitin deacetylase (PgdA/CDA1 family)